LISKDTSTPTGSYFYHSDHLGSSSLITDASGAIVQHLEYVPFGETFIDERRSQSSWTTPYLFSGKERDEETGLLYFGARYQDSKYGIWYSVDPLAEKYPNVSPYVYCLDNPVKYVDPDGRNPADHYFVVFWTQGLTQAGISTNQQSKILQKAGRDGLLRYFLPYEDFRGVITGKDLDGDKYNRAEAIAWSLAFIVPELKSFKELEIFKMSSRELKVVQYGAKHLAPSRMLWKEIVESTLKYPAKFKNAKEYIELTKKAWDEGKAVTNGKLWKVYEASEVIGASEGKETKYMRVELTESTKELHSSPITSEQYQKLTKANK